MKIISKQPNPSGAYPPVQSWSGAMPPGGYYQVANGAELSCGGFGTLIVEDDIVTGFTPDIAAWEQWQADNPVPEPQPDPQTDIMNMAVDHEYRLTMIELGM